MDIVSERDDVPKLLLASNPSHMELRARGSASAAHTHFDLRIEWHLGKQSVGGAVMQERSSKSADLAQSLEEFGESQGGVVVVTETYWFVLPPSSKGHLMWVMLSIMLIAFDMIAIPVTLAFDPEESLFMQVMNWISLCFWTFDILISFTSGYYHNGVPELRPWKIMTHYLRTWFLLDTIVVGVDWSSVVLMGERQQEVGMVRMGKTMRVLRIARSLRLLRLMKLHKMFEEVQDRIHSEIFHILIDVVKLTIVIVFINHFIACIWWAISDASESSSWIRAGDYVEQGLGYKYFTSLHWSLTQFTPASMEVTPKNLSERVFAVFVLLFALIVFSSFVSSITAAMTDLRKVSGIYDKNFAMLRRYLRERSISHDLSMRIVRYTEHRVVARKLHTQDTEVKLLDELSTPLRRELVREQYESTLSRHPLFKIVAEVDTIGMQHVCSIVSRVYFSSGDTAFMEGHYADKMFFVVSGKMRYFPPQGLENSMSDLQPSITNLTVSPSGKQFNLKRQSSYKSLDLWTVTQGDWCCEASLWTHWWHAGTLRVAEMSEVLAIESMAFAKVISLHKGVYHNVARYGRAFVLNLNEQQKACGGLVSDIACIDSEVWEEIALWAFNQDADRICSSSKEIDGVFPRCDAKKDGAALVNNEPLISL